MSRIMNMEDLEAMAPSILNWMQTIIKACISLMKLEDQLRRGTYISVFNTEKDGSPLIGTFSAGTVRRDKQEKYSRLSVEKGRRLIAHPDHLCSGQSADLTAEQYPGAIRCNNGLILSGSGLNPGELDEAAMQALAYQLSSLTTEGAMEMAKTDNNKFTKLLFQKLKFII